jgi:hypothetical protein
VAVLAGSAAIYVPDRRAVERQDASLECQNRQSLEALDVDGADNFRDVDIVAGLDGPVLDSVEEDLAGGESSVFEAELVVVVAGKH